MTTLWIPVVRSGAIATFTEASFIAGVASSYSSTPRFVFALISIVIVFEISMIEKPAYADGRPCSVASRPVISSSSDTRSPNIALMTKNVIVIVTAVQAATAAKPIN